VVAPAGGGRITVTLASPRRRPLAAFAVMALTVVGLAGLVLLIPRNPDFGQDAVGSIVLLLGFVAFGLVGMLILWQRPGNSLGWIMSAVGLLACWGVLADTYADIGISAGRGSELLLQISIWVSLWYWYPLLGLILLFTPLLFPDGRTPSPRWRPVVWLVAIDITLITFLAAFHETSGEPGESVDNPLGITGIENPEQGILGSVLFGSLFILLGTALLSVVVRYRRSGEVERHQIKWLLFATVLALLELAVGERIEDALNTTILFGLLVALFPTSIAIAIFRYRLYDIDMVINRTLVYGSLTATLVATYYGGIIVLQRLLVFVTGDESALAIVASTLAIAALFNPLRRRFQAFIDRHFYRKKYDAAKTLEAFSLRLREETDLDALGDGLVSLVRENMQPAHVTLWLRPREEK
jgi:hypothetical protein